MRLKRHLWYGVLRVLVSVMRRLPRELALVFGASFGYALHLSSTKDDFRACRNLAIAYGNRYSTRQAQRLARQAFINAGVNACDTARLCSHYTDELDRKSVV